jgi:tetratricopeptide (TPR) repeat protein
VSITLGALFQIAVSVQVADTIAARTAVPVVVRATAPGNTPPRLSVPTANGGVLQRTADVTRLGGGFGQAIATRETRYVLRASAPGTLTLSPVTAVVGGTQAISPAKTIVVLPPPTNAVPAIVARAPISRGTVVNFHSLVTPDTVWAGEQVTLQVGVFIDDELRSRLQRNPEYVSPSVDGAVAYDLPVANDALPSRDVGGARYRPFIFARALFPLRAGTLAIPPARLGYTLGSAGTLFGRQERQTATTPARSVIVRELPAEGRPASFAGAVGVYSMSATVERASGRVGDAVQLIVRIDGVGNVKLLPAPLIGISGVTVSPAGESISVDSSDLLIRGSKTFRFLLTPRRDGELQLGTLRYAYFNPVRGTYEEAASPLGMLRVSAGAVVATEEERARVVPLSLSLWSTEATSDVTEAWWYRVLFAGLALPWLALGIRRVYRLFPTREPRERRQRARGLAAGSPPTPANLRRALIERLAPLVQLRSDEPFAVPDVVRRLRKAGVTPAAAEAAGALLLRLDILTFGRESAPPDGLLRTLAAESDDLHGQLITELSTRVKSRLKAAVRCIALVVGAGGALAAQPTSFQTGNANYARQQFTQAAIAFAEAAAAAPLSAAAWTNLGAAHWMRSDTAGAIVAWQRSARLAPRDNPAIAQLRAVAPAADVRAMLVPLTPNAAWLILLAVTALLSILGGLWRWRHRAITNGALFGAMLAVAVCAGLAAVAQRAALADGLVVIRRDVALRAEPVLAGEAAARARAGEVALVTSTSESWVRVSVPGGREGWVESDAIRSLALGDGRDVAMAEARIAGEGTAP